jgi:hypothetical protein
MDENPIPPGAGAGAPPPEDCVTISRAELDALRGLAAAYEAEGSGPSRPDPEAAGEHSRLARELAARERRLAELERAFMAAVRDRELATALAGRPLVAGAAAQLIKLWRDDFDAYEEGGAYKVASKDGRPVSQVVGEWLGAPEFAHFCLPTSRGGTGARDVNKPAGAAAPPAPRNLGEAVVNKWREESAARPDNMFKPIGLRRAR